MGGGYLNFMMEVGPERIRATYRDNYLALPKSSANTIRATSST